MKRALPSLLALFVFLLFWSLLVRLQWVPAFLLPGPEQVLQGLQENSAEFTVATRSTFKSTAIGFLLSAVLGFSMALLLSSFENLKNALLPFAVFFQTVPVVAIAPLLVIWFGFGEPTVRACALIVSFFPVLANSLVGLSQADPGLKELFRSYSAGRFQTLWSLQIPSSLPSVFSGLQVSAGLAVIGAIVGEFVAGGGLGGVIDAARTQQRVDLVFGALLLSSLLGIFFVQAVRWSAKALLKVRPYFQTGLF